MIKHFEGRRPPSLDLFLEYVGLDEEEFYVIAMGHQVSPGSLTLRLFAKVTPRLTLVIGFVVMVSTLLMLRIRLVMG